MFYYYPITEFDNLFEDVFAGRSRPRARVSSSTEHAPLHRDDYCPRLDLHESQDTVTATIELPGLTSQGVAIDVHQNCLTISGESVLPESESKEDRRYIVRERCSGKFSRTLRLPFGTKPEDVKAKMENGLLTITFPKASPEQEAKHIPIH